MSATRSWAAGLALAAAACSIAAAQPTAQEDEREVETLVESLEGKIDTWERRPGERETVESDIEQDLDRLGLFYQSRFGGFLGRRGYSWRSRRLLDRTHLLLGRAAGFGGIGHGFRTSLAGAFIHFGGALGQPGALSLGRPRAAVASYGIAGRLLRGVHAGSPVFGRSSALLTGLNGRLGAFGQYGWYQPGLYGFPLQGVQQEPEKPVRAPLPDRTLGEIVDEFLAGGRDGIAGAIANMPTPGAAPSLEDLLVRYGFLEEKAGKMWAQVSELNYRLAAEGHNLQADTIAWVANLQVALEEAAAGLDDSDVDRANKGIRRGEFELTRLAKVVGN